MNYAIPICPRVLALCLLLTLAFNCSNTQKQKDTLFRLMTEKETGVHFSNQIKNTEDFNIFSYRNFYNGGGVALGDINNDDLPDIYFTSNMGANHLYLNKGNWQFEEIGQQAGVAEADKWSTGVVMADINQDGLLDIYVCNAGYQQTKPEEVGQKPGHDQQNALFINNGDLSFTESAATFGLNDNGYSTHAAFFDYDLDGDLDAYILNNSFIPVNTLNFNNRRDLPASEWPVKDFLKGGGDRLLRNEQGKFVDASKEAGIFQSLIGFGLGITIGDINGDRWPDMYVSNDFYERDYLYINQKDGSFKEDITNWMEHISLASMGADMADINNDGYPEIFVTEMLPESDERRKTTTRFENFEVYQLKQQRGFYHQYMHNTLQFNNGNQTFSEIAHFSGVAASDWSWGALMFDADNDGWRDIYVCNGVYHDVTNQDFIDFFANDVMQEMALTGEKEEMENVINEMPSVPLSNKLFQNQQNLRFVSKEMDWGMEIPSFSNGAAYGDLDLDGDLDLVVNNLKQAAFLFQNRSNEKTNHHYLAINLEGDSENPFAVGAKVSVFLKNQILNADLIPTRGFQSSIDYRMIFGLGEEMTVDSLEVLWPDHKRSVYFPTLVDTHYVFKYPVDSELATFKQKKPALTPPFEARKTNFLAHQEDDYIDFYYEGLVMRLLSKEGPAAAVGDVNGDGKQDVYLTGAQGQAGQLYLQQNNDFIAQDNENFARFAAFEETTATFVDLNNDGHLDLYVGTGGNFPSAGQHFFKDLLYFNDGRGQFRPMPRNLPQNAGNTAFVLPIDFDEDGDQDLLVGSRSTPGQYGIPPRNFLLENDGNGRFRDVILARAPQLERLGMLTDAVLVDVLPHPGKELVIVGEWMAPTIFMLTQGVFQKVETNLENYSGWWYAISTSDVDGDGDEDLILGNRGENFYFSANEDAPAKLWLGDFDQNQTFDKIVTHTIDGRDMPINMKKDLTDQLVSLKKENLKHVDYAKKSLHDLLPEALLNKALVKEATYFKSAIAINNGGVFSLQPLPTPVQFSCVCAIYCTDINGDQLPDILLAGNESGFLPQYSKLDASFGHVLINQGEGGFEVMPNQQAGFFVRGNVKQLQPIQIDGKPHIISVINDATPKVFELKSTNVVQ